MSAPKNSLKQSKSATKPAPPVRRKIFLVDDHPMMLAGLTHLIGQGKSTREVAKQLRLSPKTVDVHRGHIKEKLELKDASALIGYAIRWVEAQNAGG